jgi:hypothetical protein
MRAILLCVIASVGCELPVEIAGRHWDPRLADPKGALEVGPIDPEQTLFPRSARAYRIESFGGLKLGLDALGEPRAHLFIEGPLRGPDDPTEPGRLPVVAEAWGARARIDVTLPPGLFRVVAGSDGGRSFALRARCDERCAREAIGLRDLGARLAREGRLDVFEEALEARVARMLPPDEARLLVGQLAVLLRLGDERLLSRFPMLSAAEIARMRPLVGATPPGAPEVREVRGELIELLGGCDMDRPYPQAIDDRLSDLGVGHYADPGLTRCQVSHSTRLAQILTALAAQNGSLVEYRGQRHDSPLSLLGALAGAGHVIELANERRYLSFLPLSYRGYDVRWPLWLATGFDAAGEPLELPMGHSQHAWRVLGPDVNARVAFYQSPSGAAFFPELERQPGWTGLTRRDLGRSDEEGPARALAAIDAAARVLRRDRVERAYMPAGLLGGANDANALVEKLTRNTITTWPLLRAASLDGVRRGDGLDDAVAALPNDADLMPSRMDALTRIVAMQPQPLGPEPLLPDEALHRSLAVVTEEVLSY